MVDEDDAVETAKQDETNAEVVRAQAEAPEGTSAVDVYDEHGVHQGYKVHLAPKGSENDDLLGLASRVKGWTQLFVDGEPLEYSEDNARSLVGRFTHVAASLRRHDEENGQ